jgi:hypothetical protein
MTTDLKTFTTHLEGAEPVQADSISSAARLMAGAYGVRKYGRGVTVAKMDIETRYDPDFGVWLAVLGKRCRDGSFAVHGSVRLRVEAA